MYRKGDHFNTIIVPHICTHICDYGYLCVCMYVRYNIISVYFQLSVHGGNDAFKLFSVLN